MSKPTIAIDIDDVLAANAEGFVAFSNQRWGTNLSPDDYTEHWADIWRVDHEETERRAVELHASGAIGRYRHFDEAVGALSVLRRSFKLVLVTSRRATIEKETRAWIKKYFPDIFDEVYFAGIFDKKLHAGSWSQTKKDIFERIGAQYIIDDQLKHCAGAVEVGAQAILFGDYPWNRTDVLPGGVTRCKDWAAVLEYFDGIGRS
jgi:5'(3')-deoxyribonucleotidase